MPVFPGDGCEMAHGPPALSQTIDQEKNIISNFILISATLID